MSSRVSTFEELKIGNFEYLFIVVEWNDYQGRVATEIEKHTDTFGAHLGIKGLIVKAYKKATYSTADQVLQKNWPKDIQKKLKRSQDPIIIIIENDFSSFDPENNRWALIEFVGFYKKTDGIPKLFDTLATITSKEENLFDFLKKYKKKGSVKKILKYFEFKPGILGFSINGNAIIEDLLDID
ncbi:hypothetical protein FK220_013480 [Flavobacteriaceae bacterium TP-CH-4]|uniref:Uncharacterized protein n=1 Tax=Pelagihabitans pacificus TaxID=2696054 RepID=A0A967E772_9FLAO|nr:hypothetical protein [Pelagihabitans pacificus]NHF60360.1 hypothetical protein [Pelagihabitans pacificus]